MVTFEYNVDSVDYCVGIMSVNRPARYLEQSLAHVLKAIERHQNDSNTPKRRYLSNMRKSYLFV